MLEIYQRHLNSEMQKADEVVPASATNQKPNGYAALVAPISGWRKVFCDGSKADSAKVFVPEGKMWQINFEPMVFINSATGRIPSPKRK